MRPSGRASRAMLAATSPSLSADGSFGDRTDVWVRVFQKQAGFAVTDIDGKVGKATWEKLRPR